MNIRGVILLLATVSIAVTTPAQAAHDFIGAERRWVAVVIQPLQFTEPEERQILQMEGLQQWGAAANAWLGRYTMLGHGGVKVPGPSEVRQRALYRYVFCLQAYALQKSKPAFTTRAAMMIYRLETSDPEMGGLKEHYRKMLNDDPQLKQAYEKLRKDSPMK